MKSPAADTAQEVKKMRVTWSGFCMLFAVFGAIALGNGKEAWRYYLPISAFFAVFAAFAPAALRLLYRAWMTFALVMGVINTRIILFLIFCFVISPIGILLRLFKKDVLDTRLIPGAPSYWNKREKSPEPSDYENQY